MFVDFNPHAVIPSLLWHLTAQTSVQIIYNASNVIVLMNFYISSYFFEFWTSKIMSEKLNKLLKMSHFQQKCQDL